MARYEDITLKNHRKFRSLLIFNNIMCCSFVVGMWCIVLFVFLLLIGIVTVYFVEISPIINNISHIIESGQKFIDEDVSIISNKTQSLIDDAHYILLDKNEFVDDILSNINTTLVEIRNKIMEITPL